MTYSFWRELGISFDQAVNVLIGGYADETLSARAWRAWTKDRPFGRFFRPLIDWLFSWQDTDEEVNKAAGFIVYGHCERAFWKEKLRRDMDPDYRAA